MGSQLFFSKVDVKPIVSAVEIFQVRLLSQQLSGTLGQVPLEPWQLHFVIAVVRAFNDGVSVATHEVFNYL